MSNIDLAGKYLIAKNGETPVVLQADSTGKLLVNGDGGGGAPVSVTLQNATTAIGNGTAYTATSSVTLSLEIKGTSTSRTIYFEVTGSTGNYIAQTAFNSSNPSIMATSTTGGTNTIPEFWKISIPAGCTFRARIGAVAGGNVTIIGTVE